MRRQASAGAAAVHAGARRVADDVRRLAGDGDVDLLVEAPAWVRAVRTIYEASLIGAAVASAYLIFVDTPASTRWSIALWVWFAADYLVRLYVAEDRVDYVRRHRLELLGALPLEWFRPLRALRLLRPIGILIRATKGLRDVLGLTSFRLIATIGAAVVLGGAGLLRSVEPDTVTSYGDSLWWAVVTTTTVGYGDISPRTAEGRAIAGALMVTGIGLLGAITGEVAQRLTRRADAPPPASGDPDVDHVIARLRAWSSLTGAERKRLADLLAALAAADPVDAATAPTTPGTTAQQRYRIEEGT